MTTLRLLISDSYDPWFNLAVEECIFRQMPATQPRAVPVAQRGYGGHWTRAKPVERV